MAVAGASRFANAALLANTRGLSAQRDGLVTSLGTVSLLDVGRSLGGRNGIGLSPQARLVTKQFLESSASTFNGIFSLGIAKTATVDSLKTEINAIRAGLSDDQVAGERVLTGTEQSASFRDDNGNIIPSTERGTSINTSA